MIVSEDLLLAAESHGDPAVRKLAAQCRWLAAETLTGRAYHRRAARFAKVDEVLRQVCCGGVPLPGAMVACGLANPGPSVPLGANAGDKAALPKSRR